MRFYYHNIQYSLSITHGDLIEYYSRYSDTVDIFMINSC